LSSDSFLNLKQENKGLLYFSVNSFSTFMSSVYLDKTPLSMIRQTTLSMPLFE